MELHGTFAGMSQKPAKEVEPDDDATIDLTLTFKSTVSPADVGQLAEHLRKFVHLTVRTAKAE